MPRTKSSFSFWDLINIPNTLFSFSKIKHSVFLFLVFGQFCREERNSEPTLICHVHMFTCSRVPVHFHLHYMKSCPSYTFGDSGARTNEEARRSCSLPRPELHSCRAAVKYLLRFPSTQNYVKIHSY